MQLVAYGAQDVYLTGDPQITYFKVVYRRHTNFSMECIQQTFNGTPGSAKKVSTTISRNGDLIGAMHIAIPDRAILSAATALNQAAGHATTQSDTRQVGTFQDYVDEVTVEIGGQQIDKHYGKWLDIWYDLSTNLQNKPKSTLFTNPWHGAAADAEPPPSERSSPSSSSSLRASLGTIWRDGRRVRTRVANLGVARCSPFSREALP